MKILSSKKNFIRQGESRVLGRFFFIAGAALIAPSMPSSALADEPNMTRTIVSFAAG
jgi:hypothetical protein